MPYVCNCGQEFAQHEARTLHMGTCPSMRREPGRPCVTHFACDCLQERIQALTEIVREIGFFTSDGRCFGCALGVPVRNGYHPDRDNMWNGDQRCMKPFEKTYRKAMGIA